MLIDCPALEELQSREDPIAQSLTAQRACLWRMASEAPHGKRWTTLIMSADMNSPPPRDESIVEAALQLPPEQPAGSPQGNAKAAVEQMRTNAPPGNQCPQCASQQTVPGLLGTHGRPAVFRPARLRSFSVSQEAGVGLSSAEARACLDCGLVWTAVSTGKLRGFVQRHCRKAESAQVDQCLSCHGNRVAKGKFKPDSRQGVLPIVFGPLGRQAFTFTLGGPTFTSPAMACLDCGFLWASTSPDKLRRYIQQNCDQTPENAVAFQGAQPPSAWKEMWIGGIGVALIPIVYGFYCLYSGHSHFFRKRHGLITLEGWEAAVLAVAYVALGTYLHFHWFWGRHPRLRPWSPRLGLAAMAVFLAGLVFTGLRHFF